MANVPLVPGVPALASYIPNAIVLLEGDAVELNFGGPQLWGLYLDGVPVVTADTVTSFDFKEEWAISDYPVETDSSTNSGQAFYSYDKVQNPYTVRIRFVAGGTAAARVALLSSIASIANTLNLYDAVTPEAIYPNVNVTHYDYARTATSGLGIMIIDVWAEQVRTNTTTASNSLAPSTPIVMPGIHSPVDPITTSPVSGGNVQPLTPGAIISAAPSIPDLTTSP
jgi:hypothetical protein